MKLAVIVLCVAMVMVMVRGSPQLNSPQDLIIDSLLSNPMVVRQQIDCVLDRAGCDYIGMRLKEALPEVINRNCRACDARQNANARKIINFIQQNYPREWQEILNKTRGQAQRPNNG